tara:strand:- start:290 stop:508 length:219 start_codon:yes stop_codon:yes gene_type:complete
MSDRNSLVAEKAGLVKQIEEIIESYNKQAAELLGELPTTTQASIDPLNARIQEINSEIVKSVEAENSEACSV